MVEQVSSISKQNAASIQEIHARTDEVVESFRQVKEAALVLIGYAEEMQGAAACFKTDQKIATTGKKAIK